MPTPTEQHEDYVARYAIRYLEYLAGERDKPPQHPLIGDQEAREIAAMVKRAVLNQDESVSVRLSPQVLEALVGHLEDDMEQYDEDDEYERLPLIHEALMTLGAAYRTTERYETRFTR